MYPARHYSAPIAGKTIVIMGGGGFGQLLAQKCTARGATGGCSGARTEGRKQNFRTVGEGEGTRRKAKRLARLLNDIDGAPAKTSDRFLSWHEPGEPLPLDRPRRRSARDP